MRGGLFKTQLKSGASVAGILAFALALAACGSTSSLLGGSGLDMFGSSKAKTDTPGDQANASAADVECPGVEVRTGAATLMIGSKQDGTQPSALDLRYQGTIIRTARECQVHSGMMTMKVGIEGRIITGPAGGPGQVDVPMRIAVVQEGVSPRAITSKFARVAVTVNASIDRVTFTHVEPDLTFPMPARLSDIDAYVVYVGFDPTAAQPQPKKPAAKPKGRPAKPKQS